MLNEQDELGLILQHAHARAVHAGATEVDTDYILAALLSNPDSDLSRQLSNSVFHIPQVMPAQSAAGRELPLSTRAEKAIARAVEICYLRWRHAKLRYAHLLSALIESSDPGDPCLRLLHVWGIDVAGLQKRAEISLKLLAVHDASAEPATAIENQQVSIPEEIRCPNEASNLELPNLAETKGELSDWFDSDALKLIHFAQNTAPFDSIMVDDLIWSMSLHPDSIAGKALHSFGTLSIPDAVGSPRVNATVQSHEVFSNDVLKILTYAFEEARAFGAKKLDSGHLLVAIARAIVKSEVNTTFDEQSSLQDIATFREHVTEIRRSFDSNPAQRDLNVPFHATPFRVIDPIAVLQLPKKLAPMPCSIVVNAIFEQALEEKRFLRQNRMSYAHIALGLIRESEKNPSQHFSDRKAEIEKLSSMLAVLATRINEHLKTDQSAEVLQIAWNIAQAFHANRIEYNHIALAVIIFGGRDFSSAWSAASASSLNVIKRQLESCSVRLAAQNATLGADFYLDEEFLDRLEKDEVLLSDQSRKAIAEADEISRFLSHASKRIVDLAASYAREYKQNTIDVEMLIVALGTATESHAWKALKTAGLVLQHRDPRLFKRGKTRSSSKVVLSPNALSVMKLAIAIAESRNEALVIPEHILLAIIGECNGYAEYALETLDLDADDLNEALLQIMDENQ